jgi:penicillin-binding protein 2
MLVFDQLKKNDPQLRFIALIVLGGLVVLAGGLWWVQIVSVRDFQAHLEMQSFRTVRIPAVRGKILDRNGVVLAENRATYNVSLYLEELRKNFAGVISRDLAAARAQLKRKMEAEQKRLGRKLSAKEKKAFTLTSKERDLLYRKARYEAASNVVMQLTQQLGQPLVLNYTNFQRHYDSRTYLPLPIVTNLTPEQLAIFSEQCIEPLGADLEVQSTRVYPFTNFAAHVLGSLKRDNDSVIGEDAFFSYRLPDYRGQLGIEVAKDSALRGRAGIKSVVINNIGYRQSENVWQPAEPGSNVVLTLDIVVQRKAERALQIYGPITRGALVVMEVQTGDILAMASSPTLDPNESIQGVSPAEDARRKDVVLAPEINRATQARYAPGSIFKTIVGLACLEQGLNPNDQIYNPGYFQFRGAKPIHDRAPLGLYNFKEAMKHSSNTYFITNGLKIGIEKIIYLGQRLHLGEKMDLGTRQETGGQFPSLERVASNWLVGDTANVCIGQGEISVTPLQMAVMTAALANGGRVLWPRLVDRIEAPEPVTGPPIIFPKSRVRDQLNVKSENLRILHEAMLADTQEAGGTGVRAAVPGLEICGKTGTAEVMDSSGAKKAETLWFVSFAPYVNPRYAVVVMVETPVNAGSGGKTCAPIAANIYRALLEREKAQANKPQRLAKAN